MRATNKTLSKHKKHPISFKTFSEYVYILWRLGIMKTVDRDAAIINIVLKEWVK